MNLRSLSVCLRGWTVAELVLAVVVALVIVIPLTSGVQYAGTWDGEPSLHNRFVQDAVNIFVREHASGALLLYSQAPKRLVRFGVVGTYCPPLLASPMVLPYWVLDIR